MVQYVGRTARNFLAIRFLTVRLGKIRLFKSIDRRNRIVLPVTGKPPCPDRRADQMHGRLHARQDSACDNTVKLAQDEPFGAAGSTSERSKSLRHKPVSSNLSKGGWSGAENERIARTIRV
jgi:hypothetical protein